LKVCLWNSLLERSRNKKNKAKNIISICLSPYEYGSEFKVIITNKTMMAYH